MRRVSPIEQRGVCGAGRANRPGDKNERENEGCACPVDGRWRMASNANSADLTEAELQEARNRHT